MPEESSPRTPVPSERRDWPDIPYTPEQQIQEGVPSGAENLDAEDQGVANDEPPREAELIAEELQQVERESSGSAEQAVRGPQEAGTGG